MAVRSSGPESTSTRGSWLGNPYNLTEALDVSDAPPPQPTDPAVYSFTGSPYVLKVKLPGLGLIASDDLFSVVGDDGSNTPQNLIDFFSLGALNPTAPTADVWTEIYWNGPISSFAGNDIPTFAELGPLVSGFGIWQHGDPQALLSDRVTASYSTVPVPAVGWLVPLAFAGLSCLRRSALS
jgi:hypothetical protein